MKKQKYKFLDQYIQLGLKILYHCKLRRLAQESLAEAVNLSAAFIGHVISTKHRYINLIRYIIRYYRSFEYSSL